MAVPAKTTEFKEFPEDSRIPEAHRGAIVHLATLFAVGYDKSSVYRVAAELFYGNSDLPMAERQKRARKKVRHLVQQPWFRDIMWQRGLVELDMATPAILRGVAAKAKRGRVDAAKLALAITNRHVDKAHDVPTAVSINLIGIPRPDMQAVAAEENSHMAEVVDEEDS